MNGEQSSIYDITGRVGMAQAYRPYQNWLRERKQKQQFRNTAIGFGIKAGKAISDINRATLNQSYFSQFTGEGQKAFQLRTPDSMLDRFGMNLWRTKEDYELTPSAIKEGYTFSGGELLSAKDTGVFSDVGMDPNVTVDGIYATQADIDKAMDAARLGKDVAGDVTQEVTKDIIKGSVEEGGEAVGKDVLSSIGKNIAPGLSTISAISGLLDEDKSASDKVLGTTSAALDIATAIPGPHTPFTAIGSVASKVLNWLT